MTAKDKQAIIDYLGDWSLYKDWDSLVATFSPQAYYGRFQLLLAATIYKTIFEKIVKDPFFYIDLEEDWDGSNAALPTPYGAQLNKHLQKALKGMYYNATYVTHPVSRAMVLQISHSSVRGRCQSLACINS